MAMKKIVITIVLLMACSMLSPAAAMDFIVGAKSGYYVWVPYFTDMKGGGIEDIDQGSGVLYGPVFSILITPDISFSLAGLTGLQSTYWNSNDEMKDWQDKPSRVNGTYYVNIRRTDIDSALSYRLSENFKVFLGYKYQQIETKLRATVRAEVLATGVQTLYEGKVDIELPSHGPALGVGYSLSLGDGYFVASNLSLLYMWSEFDAKENRWDVYQPDTVTYFNFFDGNYPLPSYDTEQVGINFEPSIGVKAGERAIYTLGFRFQWIRTRFVDDAPFAPSGWMNDYIYGAFVSVLFIF
jgi:hypothetical protein